MLRIKLSRKGKKKKPIYRILVMERAKDPYGDFLENVGTYNPHTDPSTIEFKKERVEHWISKGAQPTDTVHNLLVQAGIISDKKRSVSKLGKKAKEKVKADADAAKEATKPKEEAPKEEKKEPVSAETTSDKEAPAAEAPKEEKKENPAPVEKKSE